MSPTQGGEKCYGVCKRKSKPDKESLQKGGNTKMYLE